MENQSPPRRHSLLWTLLRPLVILITKIKFNYHTKPFKASGSHFVVANHNCEWDPVFIITTFRRQVYFVTSEHILRKGAVSRFLIWGQDPIGRQKGGSAAGTVKAILRRLRSGGSVCLYPEGNRSWDGVTAPFPPATGKLARASGSPLVTFRARGSYLANPRWADNAVHRGRVDGEVVGVYPPETLRAMTNEEVNALIARDLYVDAYADQEPIPQRFRGKNLAEHLETLLFICPKCGEAHAMHSHGDRFFCAQCGYEVTMEDTGFFSGEDVIFKTVRHWRTWQDEKITALCAETPPGYPIFRDDSMELWSVDFGRSAEKISSGELALYIDKIVLPGGEEIKISQLSGISLRGPQDMYLGDGGRSFLVRSDDIKCTVKYLTACVALGMADEYGV